MSNTVILKQSNVPGKVPNVTDLELGELAVNTYDGRVYVKKNTGADSIVEVSLQYDNTDTQFTSNRIDDVLDEVDDILDTKVTTDTTASLSQLIVGDATNNAEIQSDGSLVFNGDATVWVDVDFPITIEVEKSGEPKLQTLVGNIDVPQWEVGDFMVCEGQELIHAWKEGSDVYWHCHIITNGTDTTDRYVAFEIEVARANLGEAIDFNTITSADFLIPANTPDRTHFLVPIGIQDMTGYTIGAHVYARLRRIASTGTAPTDDVFCSMLQMHIECDSIGSRQITTK